MTGVSDMRTCPICGGPMETYLETKTGESDENCRGACGYAAHQEILTNQTTNLNNWVETQFFPMSKDGRVARPEGKHKWSREEFPSVHQPVKTVLVLHYLNADSLTGKYEMSVDADGNKSVPPIEYELALLQLSAFDVLRLKGLPDENGGWNDCDYSVGIDECDGQKKFCRMSSRARWILNPDLVKAVEAERRCGDFEPKPLVPEKGRAIRFAILAPPTPTRNRCELTRSRNI
jgi:hypothetical protein